MFFAGDFGESRYFISSDNGGTNTALGTMLYMSPEMVRNEKYGLKYILFCICCFFCRHSFPSDIWSLGVILYQV
jgi:serine/threonine protein kinase